MRVAFAKRTAIRPLWIGAVALVGIINTAHAGSINTQGIGGSMPAYYDHQLFTINFSLLSSSQTLLAKNGQFNFIYQSDPGLPGGKPFISVIDAVPGDGMNPLWNEVQIAFTAGHTPRQLFSDDEIAAAKASGEITLTPTDEMYRCSVIGAAPRLSLSSGSESVGSSRSSSWSRIRAAYR